MILVTGVTGLTGSFLATELLRRNVAVRALCRSRAAAPAGAEVVLGDLADPDSLGRAMLGATGVVHAACTYTDAAVDVAAMRALLEAWRTGPFVYLSSLDVYGLSGADPITEEAPLSESYNDYATGKVVCERLLAEAAARGGRRDHVMLRAPYIWGPHPTARRRLVPERVRDGRPVVLPGVTEAEWSRYRDAWVDARDLAAIVVACLARPPGGPLNVATGHFVWHDLFAALIRLTGGSSSIVHAPLAEISDDELPRKELYAQTWRFSEDRLARVLGAVPRRALEDTLRDTVVGA